MNYDNLTQRISSGHYKPEAAYAPRPKPVEVRELDILGFLQLNPDTTYSNAARLLKTAAEESYRTKSEAYLTWREQASAKAAELESDTLAWMAEEGFQANHPIVPILRGIAYERGHSAGDSEVILHLNNLMESFKPLVEKYIFVPRDA